VTQRNEFPELYLSKPGVAFPSKRVDNDLTIARVKAQFRGSASDWPVIQAAIERVLATCGTKVRYLEDDFGARLADFSVAAARQCLEANDTQLDEVDLVVSGAIARQYFEPATAMEVAAKLGLRRTHAFDVTAACVGHLEAIQAAAAYLTLHKHMRTALICTSELFRRYLSYDIQSVKDLYTKAAGLTLGNGAACVLLRKTPWPNGGLRLLRMTTLTVPDHWQLCQAPIDGTFSSSSVELMRLGKLVPPWLEENLQALDWSGRSIDHFVFHQPSVSVVKRIIADSGGDPERGVYSHAHYGNTASASVGITYKHLLENRTVRAGDRFILGSAAAGFSVVTAYGIWQGKDSVPPGC
jgi:3-oxoacyl-[acyl-carrier-protein] synthase III